MKISSAGLDLIREFEGYHEKLPDGSCKAYRCPAGVWTLGFGCTEGVREGMTWTREQAEFALRREVAKFEAAVTALVKVDLAQPQFDALVSFAYNCGAGALAKSTILARVNARDFPGAAAAFGMWTKGGGRVLPGLVRRRQREAALFLRAEPTANPNVPQMPQAVTPDAPPTGPLRTSGTVWGTIAGTVAAVGTYVESWLAGLVEWAAKLQELSPAQYALGQMGGNIKQICLGLWIGAAVYVVSRRVRARQEGKAG